MSRRAQGLQTEEPPQEKDGPGDVAALVAQMKEQIELLLTAQFDDVERQLAKSVKERLASADALIARLSAENAALAAERERLLEEREKHTRTLNRMRELAFADR